MLLRIPKTQPRRIPVAKPGPTGRTKAPTSRPLYTSRTRKGPFLTPSSKADGLQACESSLESLFVAAATFDDRVVTIRTQPCVVDVETALVAPTRDELCGLLAQHGHPPLPRCWFVDAELTLNAMPTRAFVEVKPQAQIAAYEERLRQRAAACDRLGVRFLLVTDADLAKPLAENLVVLRRYARHPVSPALAARLTRLASHGPLSIAELMAATDSSPADVYALIARGEFRVDLHIERLGQATTVWLAGASQSEILPFSL